MTEFLRQQEEKNWPEEEGIDAHFKEEDEEEKETLIDWNDEDDESQSLFTF